MSKTTISRRHILQLALASPVIGLAPRLLAATETRLDLASLTKAPSRVVANDGESSTQVRLVRSRRGSLWQSQLVNDGKDAVRVKEVVLFDLQLHFPQTTRLYADGFQMLSQTGGTLGQPSDLGNYTDAKHYKIPAPESFRAFYGMMMLTPPNGTTHLLAFTSCHRFIGKFYLKGSSLKVVVDTEGHEIKPGEKWTLETFSFQSGPTREELFDKLSRQLTTNHPPLKFPMFPRPPTGWCSWYCFGPRVTAQQVLDNLDFISKHSPGLRYVQIDDGYQPAMGD